MPGVVIPVKNRMKIFEYLHSIGVEKLEIFLFTDSDKTAARAMLDHGYQVPEFTGWARANPNDIDLVLSMDGIRELGILMSISRCPHNNQNGAKEQVGG
jgi:isopropylmalate/homocitrate/citramalate synthase